MAGFSQVMQPQPFAKFIQDKTVSIKVPGPMGWYARIFACHLCRHLWSAYNETALLPSVLHTQLTVVPDRDGPESSRALQEFSRAPNFHVAKEDVKLFIVLPLLPEC